MTIQREAGGSRGLRKGDDREMRVLITGAAGYIGTGLTELLQDRHELRLGDIVPLEDPRSVPLDVTDPDSVAAAMQDMEAVIHLAVASGPEGPVEDDTLNQRRFDINVRGTLNVLQAAARAGVRRFVQTSSLMVVWGYPPPQWVASDAEPRPVGTYARTKLLCEVLCREFAETEKLSIVALRIPKPIDLTDPRWKTRRLRPQWIAMPDLAEAYHCALTAGEIGFEIVTVVGESSQRRWDLQKAADVLRYTPQWRLEDQGYTVGSEEESLT